MGDAARIGGFPSSTEMMWRAAVSAIWMADPLVTPATCGVTIKLSSAHSGLSAAGGSTLKLSSAAPAMRLSRRACSKAASSTMPPRAVLTSTASGFIWPSLLASIKLRVSLVRGQCRLTTSAAASRSSRFATTSKPDCRTASDAIGSSTMTRMPSAVANRPALGRSRQSRPDRSPSLRYRGR